MEKNLSKMKAEPVLVPWGHYKGYYVLERELIQEKTALFQIAFEMQSEEHRLGTEYNAIDEMKRVSFRRVIPILIEQRIKEDFLNLSHIFSESFL